MELLTPWCRVLFEKLTGLQLVKKFPAFYGTRRFITAFTSFRHPSLSWASAIQSTSPQPTSCRSILILSTHLRLGHPSGSFPTVSPPGPYTPPLLPHTSHIPSPSHSSWFYHPHNRLLGEEYRPFSSSLCSLLHSPVTLSVIGPNILHNTIWWVNPTYNKNARCNNIKYTDIFDISMMMCYSKRNIMSVLAIPLVDM